MTAGYPEMVARILAGLCVNSVPAEVLRECPVALKPAEKRRLRELYCHAHLPQGAPSSPALANLAAHLAGRIAHVEQVSSARGAKLRALFDRISWEY